MSFAINLFRPSNPRSQSQPRLEEYDSSSDNELDSHTPSLSRTKSGGFITSEAAASSSLPEQEYLLPPLGPPGRASASSTASNTPVPSRSGSPLPQYFTPHLLTSESSSDSDSEPSSPLLLETRDRSWGRDGGWWRIGNVTRRRRRRERRWTRTLRRWTRSVVRHPLFPQQPVTILLTLVLFSAFAISLTLLLIYILNPDKEPLPWRAYCSVPSTSTSPPAVLPSIPQPGTPPIPSAPGASAPIFPPPDLDDLPPAGVFVGVFSMDSALERRNLVRMSWASHPRSREGAGGGDGGVGTSRSIVRFILGQPRKDWERRIKLEMEAYNDIVILPIPENMNGGKTHTFFSWASINAWVPPVYTNVTAPQFSYSNYTTPPPPLAHHDPELAWQDHTSGRLQPWVRPDFVIKADDDSFVMLAELEARLRVELHAAQKQGATQNLSSGLMASPPGIVSSLSGFITSALPHFSPPDDPLIYWGYLVKNRFMAGELYALSWSIVDWVAKDPVVKGLTKGAEDKQTSKWMRAHPRASEIRWASERCWIYDHPRSGTVYAHGFLFPSEADRVRKNITSYPEHRLEDVVNRDIPWTAITPTPSSWTYSTVSTFGVRYAPPIPDLSAPQSVEALVEGSDLSKIREGSPMTPEYAMVNREGRKTRYANKRVGGTVVVHFIKKNVWFLETQLALLEGDEFSHSERHERGEVEPAAKRAILAQNRRP
ncbi:hypothetical protein HGRIS_007947 [Hohenbuehelia grisea]|uniref:Glycosyltransferase family 31 protein n=1 Tax=Hohenbuehelia grisea TaxID=104357 RepID=A0ABR3J6F4_9AGAR